MQAIEFEATTFQHTIRIPDDIPDGVTLRVLLLFDDNKTKNASDISEKMNDNSLEYLTMTVNNIEIPSRDER